MTKSYDPHFKRDLLKLVFLVFAVVGMLALFAITPAISTPMFISFVVTLVLSPAVAALERRGHTRFLAIALIFATLGVGSIFLAFYAMKYGGIQFDSLREKAPLYFDQTIAKLRAIEMMYKDRFPFLKPVNPTDALVLWGERTGKWFAKNGPALVGDLLTCMVLSPIFTFVLLNDSRTIRKRFFQLVPNRFFETFFLIAHEIGASLSDYIRAKLLEAFFVAAITLIGLVIVGAPYPIVLGFLAGVTNIIPYLGPVLGAIPGIIIVLLEPSGGHNLLVPVTIVYLIANLVDTVVIFPVVVAQLVKLPPLVLIAVVALGQRYYGLIGMLISIPIAAALKVVFEQIYTAVYVQRAIRNPANPNAVENEIPILGEENLG